MQHGHFLEVITHTCQRQQKGTKSGEFSGLSLRCIQPVGVSVGGLSSQEGQIMRNEDKSWKEQGLYWFGVCTVQYEKVCVHVHAHKMY